MSVVEVASVDAFSEQVAKCGKDVVVAYFWASFHEACQKGGQMDQVLELLAVKHHAAAIVKVNAEALGELAEQFGVSMVPAFVFLRKGQKVDLLEGANPAKLQSAIERNLAQAAALASAGGSGSVAAKGDAVAAEVSKLAESSRVMVFMSGAGTAPVEADSRAMLELLDHQGIKMFGTFNVQSDAAVAEHLKRVNKQDSFPQLYVGGRFVGGLDALRSLVAVDGGAKLKEMISGNLVQAARRPAPKAPAAAAPVVDDAYLTKLVGSAPVMLFMKGSPDSPSCGFSSKIVALLREHGIAFSSFDILQSPDVRAKLKVFANWPTYPQLWVSGKLVGGLDIVQEMAEDGDLGAELGIEPLEKRLQALVSRSPVMVFMKGTPAEPRCGFSRETVRILSEEGVAFDTFNILEDDEVRQGLKTFSNWPTYPQLYVGGKLVGGLDIIKELKEEDELKDALQAPPAQL